MGPHKAGPGLSAAMDAAQWLMLTRVGTDRGQIPDCCRSRMTL